ncbi:extracellular solute-binding protein [Paenibacillus hodogayensis]|uniref:Extracellular solute-binding protein n=1 Tax=Paenibacillus hodogayensis TaxID=279208 RepID=A0ABV5W571_9BACL
MKRLAQLTAFSLTAVLVLSACGSKDEKPAADSETGTGKPGKEKLSLNWLVMITNNNAQLPSDKSKDFVLKAIEDKFNVTLKLDFMPAGTDYQSKLNTRVAGGDIPDIFQIDGTNSNKFILDKVPLDMTKWATPEKMPNYFKYWINDTEMKRYQVQGVFMRAPIPFLRDQYATHYVRKDWIDALNKKDPNLKLKVPTNYDEYLAVAKAFTFNDPDGNGKNDTYAITAAANGNAIPRDFPEWIKNNLAPGFMMENGYFIDTGSDIRLSSVLTDIKAMINLKVVDPDWFLNKPGQQFDKVQQGKAGMFFATARDAAFENTPNSIQKKTKDVTGKPAEFVPFNIAPNNPIGYEALPGNAWMISSKTTDAKIERSLEILDWLGGEEGFLLTHYGQAGVHYKKEGTKIVIDPAAFKKDITDNGSFLDIWGSAFSSPTMLPDRLGLQYVNPIETDRDRQIASQVKAYKYTLLGTNLAPIVGMDLSAFRKQLYLYQNKIVFEEKDASNWPKYRAELMDKYQGKGLFEGYASQVGAALKQDLKFKSEN